MPGINIKLHRQRVEALLARYASSIGQDFPAYRNHVYRTTTYAMHLLNDDSQLEPLVETALVYHDIGLWTARELAYLEPSETLAIADNEKYQWGLDPDALRAAIHWHHKVTPYKGPHQQVVEACRKADWIDVSKGIIRNGMGRRDIKKVAASFPNLGFHAALLRLAHDYGGNTLAGGLKVSRDIVKW